MSTCHGPRATVWNDYKVSFKEMGFYNLLFFSAKYVRHIVAHGFKEKKMVPTLIFSYVSDSDSKKLIA